MDPDLADTATSVYRPLYDSDPATAPVTDPLDDDTSDDSLDDDSSHELYKPSDDSDTDTDELLKVRKRKRDELDARVSSELLTRKQMQNRGLGGSTVDFPIVLSDSESEEGDRGRVDVARDRHAAHEFIAPTTVPVEKSDGVDCFGWLDY